jgi:hypothetical protein
VELSQKVAVSLKFIDWFTESRLTSTVQ